MLFFIFFIFTCIKISIDGETHLVVGPIIYFFCFYLSLNDIFHLF